MYFPNFIKFGLALLCWTAKGHEIPTNYIGELLLTFEGYINASLALDKFDRELVDTWTTDFQVKQVNITSHYRLDMTRHRQHSFRGKRINPKWGDCLSLHETEIKKSKTSYFDGESECLKIANLADKDNLQTVHQVQKEIRQWRKSYRYLSNLCAKKYPDSQDEANICLVDYVKRDNYDVVFQRLLILKLDAMSSLLQRMNTALMELENCLKHCLHDFLETVRNIMATLNKCYERINKNS